MAADQPATLRISAAKPGEKWRPYNYGKGSRGRRIGARVHDGQPGAVVLNAYRRSRLIGSAHLSLVNRDELYGSEEFNDGDPRNGPFFTPAWRDDRHFLLLHSLWVAPNERRNGVAGELCRRVGDLGLPTYVAFAQEWVGAWFNRRYQAGAYDSDNFLYLTLRLAWLEESAEFEELDRALPEGHLTFTHSFRAEAIYNTVCDWIDDEPTEEDIISAAVDELTCSYESLPDGDREDSADGPELRGFRLADVSVTLDGELVVADVTIDVHDGAQLTSYLDFIGLLCEPVEADIVSDWPQAARALARECERRTYCLTGGSVSGAAFSASAGELVS